MTDLTAFTWQLPVAVGLVYLASFAMDRLIHILDRVGAGRLMSRATAFLLKGTGCHKVDTLRAAGYSLRAARRMTRSR